MTVRSLGHLRSLGRLLECFLLGAVVAVALTFGLLACVGPASDVKGGPVADVADVAAVAAVEERSSEPAATDLGEGAGGEAVSSAGDARILPRSYRARRVSAPITVDGRLDPVEWAGAAWSEDFIDILGSSGPKPTWRTRFKMAWDTDFLYIGAEIEEPHLWGVMTEHDSVIWHEDDFEVFIDPDGDSREYYEVEISARGTVFDLLLERKYTDGGPALHDWTVEGLRSAVFLDGTLNDPSDQDVGWSVELALPWTTLAERAHRPSPPNRGDTWRFNFSRVDWPLRVESATYQKVEGASENNWVWSPQGVVDMHQPETWGIVTFE